MCMPRSSPPTPAQSDIPRKLRPPPFASTLREADKAMPLNSNFYGFEKTAEGLGCDRTAQTNLAAAGLGGRQIGFDRIKLAVFLLTESVKLLLEPRDGLCRSR